MLRIGDYDIVSVQTGTFRLDGGAMFGVVPKVIWAGGEDVDDQNRILLATRTLVAVSQDRSRVILTDTGTGTKWLDDERARYAVRYDGTAIPRALKEYFDLSTNDVTDIIVTHLHFDHNGGLTEWANDPGGQTRLCFPNAKHWIHRKHWEYMCRATEKDRASFLERDFDILDKLNVMAFVEGDEPAAPWEGVRFFISEGHTPYQLLPIFYDDKRSLMFTGDVIPTSSHLRIPWVMAYDLEPLKTIEEKKRILQWCRDQGMRLSFPHDHRVAGGEIDFVNDRAFVGRPIDL